jgi:hypothetical protein
MHLILAENLNGWLFAAAVFFGGLLASLLGLAALIPAGVIKWDVALFRNSRGKRATSPFGAPVPFRGPSFRSERSLE